MGSKLSQPQREAYVQVEESLKGSGFKYSKGLLKQFVHWLFFYFPQVSPSSLRSDTFWQSVGEKIADLKWCGDTSGKIFSFSFGPLGLT